jgi:hypothetical protein
MTGEKMREPSESWKFARELLAVGLFTEGPTPIEWLDDIAKICECSISTLHSVAKSLGVETVEHQGKLCWRLPSNVVPFQPCPCRYEAAKGSAA